MLKNIIRINETREFKSYKNIYDFIANHVIHDIIILLISIETCLVFKYSHKINPCPFCSCEIGLDEIILNHVIFSCHHHQP